MSTYTYKFEHLRTFTSANLGLLPPDGPSCSDRLGDKPTELELCEHLTLNPLVVSKWMPLCQQLGLTQREIEAVQKDHGRDPSEVLFQCLLVWLEGQCEVRKPPTWETLLKALSRAGLSEVAKKIAFDFLKIGGHGWKNVCNFFN